MDYLYIVNAFKQQQQQFLLHQHQLQQQLQHHHHNIPSAAAGQPLSLRDQHDNSNMTNSLLWQPWRDLQHAAAVHHHLYRQQRQQEQLEKEARLSSKELPTTSWRRERRLRAGEYHQASAHQHQHLGSPGPAGGSVRSTSPSCSPPPQSVRAQQLSPTVVVGGNTSHSSAHQISMMMAAAAAATIRPLSESTNRPSPPSPSSHAVHMGHVAHAHALAAPMGVMDIDEAPLDMSVSSSLKQRNSPPPPYREPLPGSPFTSSLPRPSVITQAPPKRDSRDSALLANRENDNRSSESIDEHFRRSLGNDYFALFAKKSPAAQMKTPPPLPQQPPPVAHAGKSSTPPVSQETVASPPCYQNAPFHLAHNQHAPTVPTHNPSPALLSANTQMPGNASVVVPLGADSGSPPLPLVVRPLVQAHQTLPPQRPSFVTAPTPLPSPQSPTVKSAFVQSPLASAGGSRTSSPLPSTSPAVLQTRFTAVDNSPLSSPCHTPPVPGVALPIASPTLPAILRIKTEPGMQSIKAHNPTPPASPTSTVQPNATACSGTNHGASSPTLPSPPTSLGVTAPSAMRPTVNATPSGGSPNAEVLASVDDHFAKALGDTWKRLQENKELRK